MAHTPGPWWVDGSEEGIEVHDTFGRTASVWGDVGEESEAWANARLIAAAPELLAAVKQAVSLLSYASQDGGIYGCNADEWFGMEKSCRAAIAKAEGGADD